MVEALVMLDARWKEIAAKWVDGSEPLREEEKRELHTSLGLHLATLHAVKSLLKTMGQLRKKLARAPAKQDDEVLKVYSLKIIDEELLKVGKRRDEINRALFDELFVDDFFIRNYVMASVEGARPLPYGFVCHHAYLRELDFLKTSIARPRRRAGPRRTRRAAPWRTCSS